MTPREFHDAVVKQAADEGKLIEVGFLALRAAMLPGASEAAVAAARRIYMHGAQHLFATILAVLDPGRDPTDADLNRMSLVDAELRAFAQQEELRAARPEGSA